MEPLETTGDYDGMGAGLLVGVGLGVGDTVDGAAVAPVDGNVGSADGQQYSLVWGAGDPSGNEGVVGDIEKGVDVLCSGNLDDSVVGAAKEVRPGGGDVDRVNGTEGDVLAGLEPEGCTVSHLEEVSMGAGDAVGGAVADQYRVLRHDVVDRPFVVGDGQVDQADVPGP